MNARALAVRDATWRDLPAALAAWRPRVHTEGLVLGGALYFVLLGNTVFWKAAVPAPVDPVWVLSLLLLTTAVHGLWLSLLVWRRTARVVLSALVVATALAGHYMAAYGIYLDADMVRNVLHTDWPEARELLGTDLLWPLLSTVPVLFLLWRVRIIAVPWRRALRARLLLVLAMAAVGVVGVLSSMQTLTAFVRTQREVRYLATPANLLVSLAKVVVEDPPGRARVQLPIGEDATRAPAAANRDRPRLLVLVVGETARAANWGLNGYTRQTTPGLASREVLNFPDVTACGSSTEVSLPCMFSPYGRAHYDEQAIRGHQSLLHVLERAGVSTLWRDNQSGCKGVCTGLAVEDMRQVGDPAACTRARCDDGVLLHGLEDAARRRPGDRVLVLHMLGNHGPGYHERAPPAFQRFTPACMTADLGRCSRDAIVNAYDNAVLYTDHVLSDAIDRLQAMPDYDTALLYVSDHGESLGEKGLYLHGMPYAIAPGEQLRVPMVAWFSEGWRRSAGLDGACLRRQTHARLTHDHLFHTMLGLAEVRTALYRPAQDVFQPCRAPSAAATGTTR